MVALVLTIVTGCSVTPASADDDATAAPAVQVPEAPAAAPRPPRTRRADVQAPPGIDPDVLVPHTGESMKRGQMTIDEILPTLNVKVLPDAPAAPPVPEEQPPLQAQRAYLAGRMALAENRTFEARRQFELALNLTPNHPHVLRMLGQIWAASGNRSRSAYYLQQALAADPNDIETAFQVARLALDQGRWDVAIATFAYVRDLAAKQADADPALRSLTDYFMGSALEREGYDRAAAELLETFLKAPATASRSGIIARQLLILSRQQGILWQSVGDAHNRLDQPLRAAEAYQQAETAGLANELNLVRRIVYTEARLNRHDAARDAMLRYFSENDTSSSSLELVDYLASHGSGKQQLAEALKPVYLNKDRPERLAVTIAAMLDAEAGRAFVREHLTAKPTDRLAFEFLLEQQLRADADGVIKAGELAAAIRWTAEVIDAATGRATEFATSLLKAAADHGALLAAFDSLNEADRNRASVRFLRSMVLMRLGRLDDAEDALAKTIETDQAFVDARIRLAMIKTAKQQYDQADAVLAPLVDSNDPMVISLRVQVLSETNRTDEALALLDRMIAQSPADVDPVLQKAMLQVRIGQANAAERTLLDAVNTRPAAERLYEALFDLYDRGGVADSTDQYKRLMHRMLGNIPQSRIARLKLAELHAAGGDHAMAEKMIQSVLKEDADDFKALNQLMDILRSANRGAEADALIVERLDKQPESRPLLLIALEHYAKTKQERKQFETQERLYMMLPKGPIRARELAVLYLEWNEPNRAVTVLQEALAEKIDSAELEIVVIRLLAGALVKVGKADEADHLYEGAIKRLGDHEADLRYFWAYSLDQRGDRKRGEQMMVDLLAKFPDHAPTNNGLGYMWANEGRNLDEALKLIQKAVDDEPDSAAYLDSLGWVYYKLGRFEEAVTWLKRSRDAQGGQYPVITDHLADALYRLGQKPEAVQLWQRAMDEYNRERNRRTGGDADPELDKLDERIRAKLEAVRRNAEPAVAESQVPVKAPAAEGGAEEPPAVAVPGEANANAPAEPAPAELAPVEAAP